MNKLKAEKQEAIIAALVEGNSVRSIERLGLSSIIGQFRLPLAGKSLWIPVD